tara:strand:+ start:588 stop:872 length:285 start_codon:yes stop_codon:yes gene_type:complete
MFRNVELEETVEYTPSCPNRAEALQESDSYYFLDLYLKALPKSKMYRVQEDCGGRRLTHRLTETQELYSYTDMCWYVRAIFIPSHPLKLVVTAV